MSLSIYNPWDSFKKLQHDVDSHFQNFFEGDQGQLLADPWDHTLGLQHGIAREFENMRSQMRTAMSNITNGDEPFSPLWGGDGGQGGRKSWAGPLTDVQQSDDGKSLTYSCELPSFPKDSVKVDLQDGHLVLRGNVENKEENEGTDGKTKSVKKSVRRFQRTFALPPGVKPEDMQANWKGNKLSVTVNNVNLPQLESAKTHPIAIQ
eukprot:TRINITY_DN65536_c1_g1_i1.p1 TRINITY_DN65536_c1_g1~~TRINITY_DN65536_c1_g1_i1.p1  ORF type:complete len:206 (-),score=30.89 TRINITY_DN65536_c1_g1_i1:305-922(-)